jgi:galactokinase
VAADLRSAFVRQVEAGYQKATGLDPKVYVCRATNGAEIVV